MNITIETITPDIAKAYLEHNEGNRPLKDSTLRGLIREMKSGNFKLTHQGIAFDAAGRLIDGQHRLTACILSGSSFQSLVARDVSEESVCFVDIGVKRNVIDAIKMANKYEDSPALRNKGTAAAMNRLVSLGYKDLNLTGNEICGLMEHFQSQCEQMYRASISRRSATATVNAASLAALICGESNEDIYRFFSVYLNGDANMCEGYNIAAVFNWRQQLMDAKLHRVSFEPKRIFLGTQNAIWNFIHSDARMIKSPKNARYPVDKLFELYFTSTSKK